MSHSTKVAKKTQTYHKQQILTFSVTLVFHDFDDFMEDQKFQNGPEVQKQEPIWAHHTSFILNYVFILSGHLNRLQSVYLQ